MANKRKPGALLFFDEWNPIINTYPDEEIGKICRLSLMYSQGFNVDEEDVKTLCPELRGIWGYIRGSLDRGGIMYHEQKVKRAWGGYKKNHNMQGDIGGSAFIEWYTNSMYYNSDLFQNQDWYDSVLELANNKAKEKATTNENTPSTSFESEYDKSSGTHAQEEAGEGYRGRKKGNHFSSQGKVETSEPEILQEILEQKWKSNK